MRCARNASSDLDAHMDAQGGMGSVFVDGGEDMATEDHKATCVHCEEEIYRFRAESDPSPQRWAHEIGFSIYCPAKCPAKTLAAPKVAETQGGTTECKLEDNWCITHGQWRVSYCKAIAASKPETQPVSQDLPPLDVIEGDMAETCNDLKKLKIRDNMLAVKVAEYLDRMHCRERQIRRLKSVDDESAALATGVAASQASIILQMTAVLREYQDHFDVHDDCISCAKLWDKTYALLDGGEK
jgi:hypothetical protein